MDLKLTTMNGLIARLALESDLPEIIDLLADDEIGQNVNILTCLYQLNIMPLFVAIKADKNQLLAVFEYQNTLVGCLQLSFIPGLSRQGMWRGQIEAVRISATHRSKGFGTEMISWAIKECRARKCGLVQLTSDKTRTKAVAFYQSMGFQLSREGFKLSL
jgi:ribosomal protein S18 acetylase RimI-like enzyme